jgi:hypothetical protein
MRIANVSNLADVSDYVVDVLEDANPLIGLPARTPSCKVIGRDR